MARNCCGATCACKLVEGGDHIAITGTGTAADPFVITADVALQILDTTQFDLSLTGTGIATDPWIISGTFAASSTLDGLGDVVAAAPTNGQVLAWNSGTGKWQPTAPTTAASGSVNHDTSMVGDGSVGSPLGINEDPNGYLTTTGSGLGLNAAGKQALVVHYADDTARSAVTPGLNWLSILDSKPGVIDYYDGSNWLPLVLIRDIDAPTEFVALSGGYDGRAIVPLVRQLSFTTDAFGQFDVITAADLASYAGILSFYIQPIGAVGWHATADWNGSDHIVGTAWHADSTGTILFPTQALEAVVTAWVY